MGKLLPLDDFHQLARHVLFELLTGFLVPRGRVDELPAAAKIVGRPPAPLATYERRSAGVLTARQTTGVLPARQPSGVLPAAAPSRRSRRVLRGRHGTGRAPARGLVVPPPPQG